MSQEKGNAARFVNDSLGLYLSGMNEGYYMAPHTWQRCGNVDKQICSNVVGTYDVSSEGPWL